MDVKAIAQVLVCDQDEKSHNSIEYLCRQHGVPCLVFTTLSKALPTIAGRETETVLFVSSVCLPKELPAVREVIVLAEQEDLGREFLSGAPLRVLCKPLQPEETALTLSQALQRTETVLNYASALALLQRELRGFAHRLRSFAHSEAARENLEDSLHSFCIRSCAHAYRGSIARAENPDRLTIISQTFGGETVRCAHAAECPLREFANWVREQDRSFEAPAELLEKTQGPGCGPTAAIAAAAGRCEEGLRNLLELKMEYCSHHCSHSRQGIDFKSGDVMLSSWQALLHNSCCYCSEKECALADFFEVFQVRL